MNFNVGDTMGGYEIVGVLGSGGMGEVYRVRNVISDRVDAMKVLLANLQRDDDFATRFLREIKVQARLVHPNITQLYTAFEHNGNLMMIMELIDGSSLLEMLQRGRIPLPEAIDYVQQALTALGYAHAQGVIHRDIKPGNIMVTRSGTVKLMDFGIAKAATDRSLTITGNLIGSLYYMSPEQVKAIAIDSRSDLYSVGVVLYQMATGKKPFDGDSEYRIMRAQVEEPPPPPTSIEPSVPEELSNVILRALAKDPAERFQTGEEFREALGRVATVMRQGEGGATRILGSPEAPQERPREVPTAAVDEPVQARVPTESRQMDAPNPSATPQTPPRPAALPTGPRQTARPAAADEDAGEKPARSRTPLWIAAGIAAAVLIVVATQVFDWMATESPGGASSERAGRLETPAEPAQPPVSDSGSDSPAPPNPVATPGAGSTQERSQGQTQPRTPATGSAAGDLAASGTSANPPGRSEPPANTAANRTAPVSPTPTRPAPVASNREPARTDSVPAPPSAAPPPAPPTGVQASASAAGAARTPGTAVAEPPAPQSAPPQQQAPATAGGQPADAPPAAASPAADRVYLPNEVDSLPEVLHRVQPRYSGEAARARAEGVVRLEAEIWPDGRTRNIRIVQSAGHADLDRNAVEALRQWNFVPGRKDGVAVKIRARIDFPFSLQTTSQRPALTKDR